MRRLVRVVAAIRGAATSDAATCGAAISGAAIVGAAIFGAAIVGAAIFGAAIFGAACNDEGTFSSIKLCQKTCDTSDECCAQPPCDKGMHAVKCEYGLCRLKGCATDGDCSVIPNAKCFQVTQNGVSIGACKIPCKRDQDCSTLKQSCLPEGYCGSTTATGGAQCKADADCAQTPGHPRCDLATGTCICEDDETCQTKLGSADYLCAGL